MRTQDLTGAQLDWAVAKCEGVNEEAFHLYYEPTEPADYDSHGYPEFHYSTVWAQGGPIIERERIDIAYTAEGWYANMYWRGQDNTIGAGDSYRCGGDGPTPLIAAMRCFCASRLGDVVDIPEELT